MGIDFAPQTIDYIENVLYTNANRNYKNEELVMRVEI
jgi:hypothetical protein